MKRRNFISFLGLSYLAGTQKLSAQNSELNDRAYWVSTLKKIAEPILNDLSKNKFKANFEIELSPKWDNRNKNVAYLEAFSRLLVGISPLLNLPEDSTLEGQLRNDLLKKSLSSIKNAVNPQAPDYMMWQGEGQTLVDAAFFAQALYKAKNKLWEPLYAESKAQLVSVLKLQRKVNPAYSNWLLFAAMTEAFLLSIGEEADLFRIDMAIRKIEEWYLGDGWFGDGPNFHMDYYNSFVIHSMLVDVLEILKTHHKNKNQYEEKYQLAIKRMVRHSEFLERMISPEGSFPAFGRSMTYRMGVFQSLTHSVLLNKYPEEISPGQIRAGLTTVMKKMFEFEGTFNNKGYLNLGLVGHQPDLADSYTNTGSLYLTSLVFLPLGLPENDVFWTSKSEDWTQKKAWSGKPFRKDYHVGY
jgi:hypothetical protein